MEEKIRRLLSIAVHAPSGDNSQPWSFTIVHGDTLRVHLNPDMDNPILNFKFSGTYIAHGALIENILVGAPSFGLEAKLKILPDSKDIYCIAEISFIEVPISSDQLATVIKNRHTNRKPYTKRAICADIINEIINSASGIDDTKLFLTEDSTKIHSIASSLALMEQVSLETPKLRKLFIESILWNKYENDSGKSGLFIDTMELPLPARFILRNLSNSIVSRIADAVGFSKMARITNSKLYASSSAMGLITITKERPDAYLNAGRLLEKVWLESTQHGLSFQPVTGILFISRSIAHGTSRNLFKRHADEVLDANANIKMQFGVTDDMIPAMLFRIGYSKPATDRSFRREPDIKIK